MTTLTIELYGIPRQRAGCARCELHFAAGQVTLQAALSRLAEELPGLAGECIRNGCLLPAYAANLGGERFVSDPDFILPDGAELLILSADAGG